MMSLHDILLGAGARRGYRHYGDEELHQARLAVWREKANAADLAPEFVAAYGPGAGPQRLIDWCLYLGRVRAAIEEEEAFRERARARGVPRDAGRGWVPDDVIRQIRERVDLAALILSWGLTDLRPLGRGKWAGCCPFHADDSPSFYVYQHDPADQHFHCFGCGRHGDVFALAREHGPWLSFREAAEGLAGVAGIAWPPPDGPGPNVTPLHRPWAPEYARLGRG